MKYLMIVALVVSVLAGCCQVTEYEEFETITRLELGRALARKLGVGIIISVEKDFYEIVPIPKFLELLADFNPEGSPLDAANSLVNSSKMTFTPRAAIGVALLGPPDNAHYSVVYYASREDLYLVDPINKGLVKWDFIIEEGAWVSF